MAVRQWDPVDDVIDVDDGGFGALGTSAYTALALFQPNAVVDTRPIICVAALGADPNITLAQQNASLAWADQDEFVEPSGAITMVADTWWIVAVTAASGATITPRFHASPLVGGSWVHSNASATATKDSFTADGFRFGRFTAGGGGFMDGMLAFAAVWKSELSDANIEAVKTNASSGFVVSDLAPFAAWNFNQASVTDDVLDLVGSCDQTARTGTTVVTGSDPAWVFDLSSRAVDPDQSNFPKEKIAA